MHHSAAAVDEIPPGRHVGMPEWIKVKIGFCLSLNLGRVGFSPVFVAAV